ncbi:PHP domain-containing protein [Neomoorella thermoacetica]|uniref:PHP domain-containing protein n=1 Tax=Neomoorella thermoacetica TaxID=1525 RepID=UPI000039B4A9|nr:PHP domain-containing protein [Moorella thermoacetica]
MSLVYADLHIHTLASDGSLAPAAILELARQKGLKALSFTDHESLSGYIQVYNQARELGLELLPGIEMVTSFRGREIHLLGYNFDPTAPVLASALEEIRRERRIIARQVIRRLQNLGFNISWEQVEALIPPGGVLGKNHILQVLRHCGYIDNQEKTIEFLRRYLGPGGLAYIPYEGNPLPRAVALIHAAGGISVLAHPGLINDDTLVNCILEEGIDGLEVFYYYLGSKRRELIHSYYRLAKERHLLITGGTDFHGLYAPVALGTMGISAAMLAGLSKHQPPGANISPGEVSFLR